MCSLRPVLVAVALVLSATTAHGEDVTSVAAVQKVIQMLQDMSVKAKSEKNEEEISYAKFRTWCGLEQQNLQSTVEKEANQIELLSANIGQLNSDVGNLGDQIAQLGADVTKYEAENKKQQEQRKKDHAEFLTESQDYDESVDALERAISVLQKQSFDRKGAQAALLQLSESLPNEAKSMLTAFVGMMGDDESEDSSTDFMARSAPEANAYEFQSGGVVDMLKRLRDDFRQKKSECEKEEMNSRHAFNMIVQDLTDSAENAKKDTDEKTGQRERKKEEAAEDKKQLGGTTECKAADEKTLADMKIECTQKGLSFEEKQKLRAEEIEAIEKAIEILSSGAVSGNAETHLTLAQKATTFLQVSGGGGAATSRNEGIHRKIRDFLAAESQRLHSQGLGLLAQKLAADPFAKVKKLIDDMITRLLEEANGDASHEGFCDKELGTNKITRDKMTEEIDQLDAAVESGKASIASLTADIAALSQEIAELDQALSEATKLRTSEKAKNAATIADAADAQKAVVAATAILTDYYKKASMATALVQAPQMGSEEWNALANPDYVTGGGSKTVDKGHKAGMQTFGAAYAGQQDEAGGVLAILEVVLSDFANLQSDTEASETVAQKEYDDFMNESNKNKATKSKKIEMNTTDRAEAQSKLQEDTIDMKSTQDQLLAADRYYAKLVPQCMDKGQTFDERAKARQDEITSLREALSILSAEDIATSAL